VLLTSQLPHFVDLPPSQIVPTMVDAGYYLASESTFYRVLREADQQHERGRARRRSSATATTNKAVGPNQV